MTTYDKSEALSSRDITTVTIAGCFNNFLDGSQANLTLRRGTPYPNKEDVDDPLDSDETSAVQISPPVALHSPDDVLDRPSVGKLHARLLLEEKLIAQGEFGIVMEANIDLSSSSPELARMKLPHLVATKEVLQDSERSVLLRVTIPEGVRFRHWPVEKSRIDNFELETYGEHSDDEDHIAYPRVLTLLLLECLGNPPSRQTTMDDLESLKSQAYEMFSELSHLCVKHGDIHSHNIVRAAPRLPDFPNLLFPRHQRV
ncbi:unnamed protein product [Somion occarium]|uniref:Protein kinase domain-containing protein n=1 Tax=Somion occarium TaxID=3059160 RepID=A0ABP1E2L2_9APHY